MKKLIVLSVLLLSGCIDYSHGERVGTLIKFSNKGLFKKTWEGQLLLGGVDDKGVPVSWEFAVDPYAKHGENTASLVEQLQRLQGRRVKITYQQEWVTGLLRSESDYFVQAVNEVTDEKVSK